MKELKIVITGGPGTGKTTLCKELLELGCVIGPESARPIIRRQTRRKQNNLSYTLPDENPVAFQQLILNHQTTIEDSVKGTIILDRGIVDNVAYCRFFNEPIPSFLEDAILERRRYDYVFILDPLPNYKQDKERQETREQALQLQELITKAYESVDYSPLHIPAYKKDVQNAKHPLLYTPTERAELLIKEVPELSRDLGFADEQPFL